MPKDDSYFRENVMSMLDILSVTFGYSMYDYQKEIILDRIVFEKKIAERECKFREMEE